MSIGRALLLLALPPLGYVGWREWRKKHETAKPEGEPKLDSPPSTAADVAPPAPSPPPPPGPTVDASTWKNVTAPELTKSHPPLGRRLTTSSRTADGHVSPSDQELLVQAKRVDGAITLDELAAARLIASERGDEGTAIEWLCIVDAELNHAEQRKSTLYASLTQGQGFGAQGIHRPASTLLDPHEGHLAAARAVLSGQGRGVARGAIAFFDPADADAESREGRLRCDAFGILKRWSYDVALKGSTGCEVDWSRAGTDTHAWVGPIEGVDAWRLMLFQPMKVTATDHFARYVAALTLITEARSAGKKAVS